MQRHTFCEAQCKVSLGLYHGSQESQSYLGTLQDICSTTPGIRSHGVHGQMQILNLEIFTNRAQGV